MTHRLKTWQPYFDEIVNGNKTFELRRNDRDYKVGDTLVLYEFDPETKTETGSEQSVEVTYITDGGKFGALSPGWICMGFRKIEGA